MTPALLAALGFLAPLVEEAILSAIRDAVELTDEERAARVDRLLAKIEEEEGGPRARWLAAGQHRDAIKSERRVARWKARVAALAAGLKE